MKVFMCEQRTDEWYKLRSGNPTASEFSRIITSKGEPSKSFSGYAMTLAAEKFAKKAVDQWEGNKWTERGRELEVEALQRYEFTADADIQRIGFAMDDAELMGCSPDGLVGDDGMVEVKCLKAENHIKAILYFKQHGRCLPDYVQQTQGQLLIGERSWCDLIFYHPDLPWLVIRQEPDPRIQRAIYDLIPPLCAERDQILAVLEAQAGNGDVTVVPASFTDLNSAAPVF